MVTVTSIDISGLQSAIIGLQNALIGTGGDASTIVADESKLLAKEISNLIGPLDQKKTKDRIEKSVRSKFLALDDIDNSKFSSKGGTTGNVVWYRCDRNFLYGAAKDRDMRKASGEALADVYYASRKVQGRTRIIADFTPARKHQRVAITARIITSKASLARAVKSVQLAIGKLKASWFATAKSIDHSLVGPQWIERHIKGNRTTKSITDLTSMNVPATPSVTFGSKALGNDKFTRLIDFAVKLRAKKVMARLDLVLTGYSHDVAAGIKAKRRGHHNP
jgi:hypothetical protein